MISIKNSNQLDLNYMLENISQEYILNSNDFILMSLPYPFDEELYNKNLKSIYNMANKEKIKSSTGYINLVFDLVKSRPGNYEGWKFIIDFAKKHNIKFKLNEMYAISPLALEKYIENFSKTNSNGEKSLLFSRQSFLSNSNVLTSTNETIFTNEQAKLELFEINKNLTKNVDEYLSLKNQSLISLHLSNENKFDKKQLKIVKTLIKHLKANNKKLDLCLFSKHYYFSNKEFKNLLILENYIKKTYDKDYELKFYTGNEISSKKQILKANSIIDSIVNDLKTCSLSPYEKLIYVRKLLTEKPYLYENDSSQDIYSALTSRQAVCVSYSLIFKAIFDELNNPNIKVNVQIYNNSNSVYHALNNVYVNDDKYKIEGYYDCDLTNSPSNLLTNFMISPEDTFNSCKEKSIEKVDFFTLGNLLDNRRICYFSKDLNDHDHTINKTIEKNTLKYLNTPMGKKALVKSKEKKHNNSTHYLYYAIKHCLDNTIPIPIEKTKKALENVSKIKFRMSENDAQKYSSNVILETIFNSLFDYDRNNCKNTFSTSSLEIEKTNNLYDSVSSPSIKNKDETNLESAKKRSLR